jgi:flagellin-like protein
MKGVSPVVAAVLLIAIAVIAAVGIWFWIGGFTSKPSLPPQQQVALSVENCNGSHVVVRNTGGIDALSAASINNVSNSYVGYIDISDLAGGTVNTFQICDFNNVCPTTKLVPGIYEIEDQDYPSYKFSC